MAWTETVWGIVEFRVHVYCSENWGCINCGEILEWPKKRRPLRRLPLHGVAFGRLNVVHLCTLGGGVCVHVHCAAAAQTDRKCVALLLQVCAVHEQFNKSRSLVSQTRLVGRRQSRYSVTLLSSTFLIELTQHRKCT